MFPTLPPHLLQGLPQAASDRAKAMMSEVVKACSPERVQACEDFLKSLVKGGEAPWVSPCVSIAWWRWWLTYPISNNISRDLLFLHRPEVAEWAQSGWSEPHSSRLDVCLAGCGDVNHLLWTLHQNCEELARPLTRHRDPSPKEESIGVAVPSAASSSSSVAVEETDRRVPFLRFHLVDCLKEILARDIVVLCAGLWCEGKTHAFDIWARQRLKRGPYEALKRVLARLIRLGEAEVARVRKFSADGEGSPSLLVYKEESGEVAAGHPASISFYRLSDLTDVLEMWKSWASFEMEDAAFVKMRRRWFREYVRSHVANQFQAKQVEKDDVFAAFLSLCVPTHLSSCQQAVEAYVRSAGATSEIASQFVNPTFFGPPERHYRVHPSTTPIHPFQYAGTLTKIRSEFGEMMQSWRRLFSAGVTSLSVFVGDAIEFLDRPHLRRQQLFDFVYTSNLADNVGPLNIVLSGKSALRTLPRRGFLEIESMKALFLLPEGTGSGDRHMTAQFYWEGVFPFSPDLATSLLGLEYCNPLDSLPTHSTGIRERLASVRLYFAPRAAMPPVVVDFDETYGQGKLLRALVAMLRDIVVWGATIGRKTKHLLHTRSMVAAGATMESFFKVLDTLATGLGGVQLTREAFLRLFRLILEPSVSAFRSFQLDSDLEEFVRELKFHKFEIRALIALHFPALYSLPLVLCSIFVKWTFEGRGTANLRVGFHSYGGRGDGAVVWRSVFDPMIISRDGQNILVGFFMLQADFQFLNRADAVGTLMNRESRKTSDQAEMEARVSATMGARAEASRMMIQTMTTFAPCGGSAGPFPIGAPCEPTSSVSLLPAVSREYQFLDCGDCFKAVFHVGPDGIEEAPGSALSSDSLCFVATVGAKEYRIRLPAKLLSKDRVRFQRSRRRQSLFVVFPKDGFEAGTGREKFTERAKPSSSSPRSFASLPLWDASDSPAMIQRLSRDMFTTLEITRSMDRSAGWERPTDDDDYRLRNNVYYLLHHALRNGPRVIIKITEGAVGTKDEDHHWQWLVLVEEIREFQQLPIVRVCYLDIAKDREPATLQIGLSALQFIAGLGKGGPGISVIAMSRAEQRVIHDYLDEFRSSFSLKKHPDAPPVGIQYSVLRPVFPAKTSSSDDVWREFERNLRSMGIDDPTALMKGMDRDKAESFMRGLAGTKSQRDMQRFVKRFRPSQSQQSSCAFCGKKDAKKKCSRCKKVYYCDRRCQGLHWKRTHRAECRV